MDEDDGIEEDMRDKEEGKSKEFFIEMNYNIS